MIQGSFAVAPGACRLGNMERNSPTKPLALSECGDEALLSRAVIFASSDDERLWPGFLSLFGQLLFSIGLSRIGNNFLLENIAAQHRVGP